jgi:hypothetical protein
MVSNLSKYYHPILILLLVIDIALTVYLIFLYVKKEPFCNCFAAQYDGSEGDPNHKSYYGGYCYDKEKTTQEYQEGLFQPGV